MFESEMAVDTDVDARFFKLLNRGLQFGEVFVHKL